MDARHAQRPGRRHIDELGADAGHRSVERRPEPLEPADVDTADRVGHRQRRQPVQAGAERAATAGGELGGVDVRQRAQVAHRVHQGQPGRHPTADLAARPEELPAGEGTVAVHAEDAAVDDTDLQREDQPVAQLVGGDGQEQP
ncbi:hypothetical protein ACQEV4_18145 [Streptomyces shenzhenensis]|uniref:hypothetical protein n=1 Tax=Streptomyces shenzhenensis TaxID=943815 RepID=UPI003D8BD03A